MGVGGGAGRPEAAPPGPDGAGLVVAEHTRIGIYEAGRRSMGLAYLLWFFLGTFGAHRFYLKRTGSGWVQFGVHVGGWLLIALALWRVGQGSYVETAQSRSEEHTSELQS